MPEENSTEIEVDQSNEEVAPEDTDALTDMLNELNKEEEVTEATPEENADDVALQRRQRRVGPQVRLEAHSAAGLGVAELGEAQAHRAQHERGHHPGHHQLHEREAAAPNWVAPGSGCRMTPRSLHLRSTFPAGRSAPAGLATRAGPLAGARRCRSGR